MVGGTKLPPQDSQSEPGCYERKTRATARTKAKTLYEGKRQKPSQVYVSLDNADTVIDGQSTARAGHGRRGMPQKAAVDEAGPRRVASSESGSVGQLSPARVARDGRSTRRLAGEVGSRRRGTIPAE